MNTFALIVGTRGHPRRADSAIEVAMHLAYAPERIIPVVSIDNDDMRSVAHKWGERIIVIKGPRPIGLGDVWNRAANNIDAEFYIHAGDDGIISTPGWDVILDKELSSFPLRELAIVCLNDRTNHNIPTHPVVSREWIRLNGNWFDNRFPFWFIDIALAEIAAFTSGSPIIISEVSVSVKSAKNARMRDLKLWSTFYRETRKERLIKAREIRKILGISVEQNTIDSMVNSAEKSNTMMINDSDEIEKIVADMSTSLPIGYEEAKKYAQNYIDSNGTS